MSRGHNVGKTLALHKRVYMCLHVVYGMVKGHHHLLVSLILRGGSAAGYYFVRWN